MKNHLKHKLKHRVAAIPAAGLSSHTGKVKEYTGKNMSVRITQTSNSTATAIYLDAFD